MYTTEELRQARKKKKLTMSALSELAKISEGHYCNIEKGKRTPSVPLAKKLAEILDLDWTKFF